MSNETEHEVTSALSFFKGFLFGGLLGAGFALVFAPKPGKELRDDIKKKSLDLKEEADVALADIKVKAAAIIEEGKKTAEALLKEADARLTEAKQKASEILDSGIKIVDTVEEAVEEVVEKAVETVGSGKDAAISKRKKVKDAVKAAKKAFDEEKESVLKKENS